MTILRNTHKESQMTLKRLFVVCLGFIALFTILTSQLYKLQIRDREKYQELSEKNSFQKRKIAPFRADIVDRNFIPVATYSKELRLDINDLPTSSDLKHLDYIGLSLDPELNKGSIQLEPHQFAYLSNQDLQNLNLRAYSERFYPLGPASAHILGYTGIPKVNHNKIIGYNPDSRFIVGHSGLEKEFDAHLQGDIGIEHLSVNAQMKVIHQEVEKKPMRAAPLQLTIDSKLQSAAYDALIGHTGSVIILNPNNGEILAAVSSPSFDPKKPSEYELKKLNNIHDDQPMFSRFSRSLYPPASVIKPFIALMALQHGDISISESIDDTGVYQISENTRVFRDWKKNGHGKVNVIKAIAVSCDVYFYQLAQKLGIDKLTSYLSEMKFGEKTNIDIGSEAKPIIPTEAYRKKRHNKWYPGQTVITGIGQGDILCSPLQLARSTMLIANGGVDYPLHLVKKQDLEPPSKIDIDETSRKHVVSAMEQVMTYGTGKSIGELPFSVAGKTGSAQVSKFENSDTYKALPRHMKDHHLFVGFAPSENPDIVVIVIIEHQHTALNIAKQVLKWCWDHKVINNEQHQNKAIKT